jgi:hypothetical protein
MSAREEHPTVKAIDAAIVQCAQYAQDHATGAARYGWGWCADAAKVALTLAEVRIAVVRSLITERDAVAEAGGS